MDNLIFLQIIEDAPHYFGRAIYTSILKSILKTENISGGLREAGERPTEKETNGTAEMVIVRWKNNQPARYERWNHKHRAVCVHVYRRLRTTTSPHRDHEWHKGEYRVHRNVMGGSLCGRVLTLLRNSIAALENISDFCTTLESGSMNYLRTLLYRMIGSSLIYAIYS